MKILSDLLTIVIPIKNEEKNLPGCLACLHAFPHVVLVDSGSTDTSRALFDAARQTARQPWTWLDFAWDGKFPKKRNWTLRQFSFQTPWVLFLDADERLTDAWLAAAAVFLASPAADAADVVKCYYDNWFLGRLLRHGDPMQKSALARVGAAAYETVDEENWSSLDMEIHEQLLPKRPGAIAEIRARLEHHDHRSLESHRRKHEEYAKWEANRFLQLKAHPERQALLTARQKRKYGNLDKSWFAAAYFVAAYVLKGGFLDGFAGLRFALFKAWYFSRVRRLIRQ